MTKSQLDRIASAPIMPLLLGSLAAGAVLPRAGQWLRTPWTESEPGAATCISFPTVVLAVILFNAGLAAAQQPWRHLLRKPRLLLLGLLANWLAPLALLALFGGAARALFQDALLADLLLGLAIVASMPIAGVSTAWSQNVRGDAALSLGLVLITTLASPLTSPVALWLLNVALGGADPTLVGLARDFAPLFLLFWVILPSAAGLACGRLLGRSRHAPLKPWIKLINLSAILLLNFANASLMEPAFRHAQSYGAIVAAAGLAWGLCIAMFALGSFIGKQTRAKNDERVALIYGLGMNNNGTALVMASVGLATRPAAVLSIFCYTIAQHLTAAWWSRRLASQSPRAGS